MFCSCWRASVHTKLPPWRIISTFHPLNSAAKLPVTQGVSSSYATSTGSQDIKSAIDCVDTSFTDASSTTFRNKTLHELRRAFTVLSLCSVETLVKNNQRLLGLSRRVLGVRLHQRLMDKTFYGQFVIGKEERTVRPIIQRYLKDGVGPILYFALEEDRSPNRTLSNDPFYSSNVKSFIEAIDLTSAATDGGGYIAVKPTALCSPDLWVRMTDVIQNRTRDVSADVYHDMSDLVANPTHSGGDENINLNDEEITELQKLTQRAGQIIERAMEKKVKVMIDAEQTYFQPAIQRILGVDSMSRYNTDSVNVLVTYQTYLKGMNLTIQRDMDYCRNQDIKFGARIVRGAYLDQERSLAKEHGYADPTNLNFDATTSMYHQTCDSVIKELLNRGEGQLEVMFATHNEETLRYLFQRLRKEATLPADSIRFGQIYGMCDHITFHLGQCGVPVYKSMPYGPIELVTSYLGRRAVENRGVLEKVKKERQLLAKELKRRKSK